MTVKLPPMPSRIARLPRDERGYPVPRFVEWFKDGEVTLRPPPGMAPLPGAAPDFRYADAGFRYLAFKRGLCWICGEPLGVHKVYAIGPMCVVNRVTSEPASHRDCAEFAAKACPFLTTPRRRRDEEGLDPEAAAPGIMIDRNPGVVCLYETPLAKAFNAGLGQGWLIRLDAPVRVDWWAEGRQATLEEVKASIESGFPLLMDMAEQEGPAAIAELMKMSVDAMRYLPAVETMH
jgi:hypothetical protein